MSKKKPLPKSLEGTLDCKQGTYDEFHPRWMLVQILAYRNNFVTVSKFENM